MGFLRRLFGGRLHHEISEAEWTGVLEQHPILRDLTAGQQAVLRERTGEVLRRISIEYAVGVPESTELRLSVAVQAALPILELGIDWYRTVRTILLVPEEYETELESVDEAGVVHEGVDTISGEVGPQRPVVLSIADVEASGWGDGYNVVIHEMAHVLDSADGELDGVPPLPAGVDSRRWHEVTTAARRDHERRVRRGAGIKGPVIDPYGAEGPEEFFACASELFFERPRRLARAYPELYEQLVLFFGFDPRGGSGGGCA
ncbi:MAG: zinc-dependent peptidase, partial [Spirochaetaceae bacterium]